MAKVKVTLCRRNGDLIQTNIIDVNDTELADCTNEDEVEEVLCDHWMDWRDDYLTGTWELLKEGDSC